MNQRLFKRQSGNVIFVILVAIALLAALTYSVTRSSRSTGHLTQEQASVYADSILGYSAKISAATDLVLQSGIDVSALDFGPSWDTPCTSGAACIFAPEGGGARMEPTPNDSATYYKYATGGSVVDVGTSSNDIYMLTWVPLAICEKINQKLGLPVPPTQNSTISADNNLNVIDAYPGKRTGCYEQFDWGAGTYAYYHVLVEQ